MDGERGILARAEHHEEALEALKTAIALTRDRGGGSMDLLERTRAIILRPRETWAMVKGEQTTAKELFTSYAAILALIPPLAQFVGFSLVERRMPVQGGLAMALFVYGFSLLGVYVMAYVANWLAPKFNSQRDMTSAMKAIVFSCTPMWIASILTPIPGLSVLVIVGALYSLYLLFMVCLR
jgi:hypothetical protein